MTEAVAVLPTMKPLPSLWQWQRVMCQHQHVPLSLAMSYERGTGNRVMPVLCLTRPVKRAATQTDSGPLTFHFSAPATHMSMSYSASCCRVKAPSAQAINECSEGRSQCISDMQCTDNTAAKLVVVIAAAIMANAESYIKSFSALSPSAAAETTIWYARTVVSQSCSKHLEHMAPYKVHVSFGHRQQ